MRKREPRMIGWREWLALPSLGVPGIKAKIDTGARTSSLHTHDYEVFEKGKRTFVRFHLHPLRRSKEVLLTCEAVVSDFREVRDSGGHAERRPFIKTAVRVGEIEWEVELSLSNREGMKFRMLLGREALADRFAVDPGASYLIGKSLRGCYAQSSGGGQEKERAR